MKKIGTAYVGERSAPISQYSFSNFHDPPEVYSGVGVRGLDLGPKMFNFRIDAFLPVQRGEELVVVLDEDEGHDHYRVEIFRDFHDLEFDTSGKTEGLALEHQRVTEPSKLNEKRYPYVVAQEVSGLDREPSMAGDLVQAEEDEFYTPYQEYGETKEEAVETWLTDLGEE